MRKGENIYKRKDGRWEGRYKKGRNAERKLVYGYVYGKHYSEVKEKLSRQKSQSRRTTVTSDHYHGTVNDWCKYWLETIKKNQVKESTYSNYYGKMQNHIFPFFKNIKLVDLKLEQLEYFANYLNEKALSPVTIHSIFFIIKNVTKKAASDHLLGSDPCLNVSLPSIKKKETLILSIKEQKELEQMLIRQNKCSASLIALYTGMRIGEISGLKWTDIDWEKGCIHVRRTVSRISTFTEEKQKTKIIIDRPKTDNSYRVIPMAKNLKTYLYSRKKEKASDFVISCKNAYTEPRIINYRFKQELKKAGIRQLKFHLLRHTFATRCIEKGVDIATLSQILGHSSVKMTLDTYLTSMWENKQLAIEKLDKNLDQYLVEYDTDEAY